MVVFALSTEKFQWLKSSARSQSINASWLALILDGFLSYFRCERTTFQWILPQRYPSIENLLQFSFWQWLLVENFQCLFRPIFNRPDQRKSLFESKYPCSGESTLEILGLILVFQLFSVLEFPSSSYFLIWSGLLLICTCTVCCVTQHVCCS